MADTEHIGFRCPKDLKKWLKKRADKSGRKDISKEVVQILSEARSREAQKI